MEDHSRGEKKEGILEVTRVIAGNETTATTATWMKRIDLTIVIADPTTTDAIVGLVRRGRSSGMRGVLGTRRGPGHDAHRSHVPGAGAGNIEPTAIEGDRARPCWKILRRTICLSPKRTSQRLPPNTVAMAPTTPSKSALPLYPQIPTPWTPSSALHHLP